MAVKRTYNPPKTFGVKFEGLVNLLITKGFTCSGIDVEECKQAVLRQRMSKAAFEALKASFVEAHARYLEEQAERHMLYSRLLNAARGAYRHDKAMLAALANFQRDVTRRSPSDEAPQQDAATVAQPSQVLPKIATA